MKHILTVLLLLLSFACFSQTPFNRGSPSVLERDAHEQGYLTLIVPVVADTASYVGVDSLAATLYSKATGKVYYRDTTLGGHKWTEFGSGSGSAILLQTNGVDNGDQTILNLTQGNNITLTDNGSGVVTFDATGASILDTSTTWAVLDSLSTPPVAPATGDIYLVGTSPSGAWVGHANEIATWGGASWTFQSATVGDLLNNAQNGIVSKWTGTVWVRIGKLVIHQGGDAYGVILNIGANDNKGLRFKTNGVFRYTISSTGTHTFNSLTGSGEALMGLDATGLASRVIIGTGLSYNSGTGTLTATGGGSTNSNIGSGYRLAVPNTNNIKTLHAGTNITLDSVANANEITINSTASGATDTVNVSNVLSYGADSTGVVDATSAFNAAIANALLLPIGKQRVYVPHGTYLITNAVLKASSQTNKKGIELQNGIELYGDGRYTIIKAANHTTGDTSNTNWYPLINGQYRSNCYVHDITLDGNKANQNVYNANPYVNPSGHNDTSAHYNENGIYFRNGDNNNINRVWVHDAACFGIEFYNCSNSYTGNSTSSLTGMAGIAYTTKTSGIIENCFLTLNNSDQIRVDNCNTGSISITNTETSWSGSNAGATNWFAGLWVNNSANVNVEGLYSHDNSAYGVDWGATDSTYQGNRITNSSIYYNGNGGIIVGAGAPIIISHNVIKNNGKKSDGVTDTKSNYNPAAIVVNNGKYLTITSNYAIDTTGTWAQIWFVKNWGGGGSVLNTRNNISNNIIRGVADTAHAYNGVNDGNNILLDNQMFTSAGVLINPASDTKVWTLTNSVPGWSAVSSSVSLTATQVGYGSASNLLTSINKFRWSGDTTLIIQDSVGAGAFNTGVGLNLQSDTATAGGTLQSSPSLRFSTTVNAGTGTSFYMRNEPTATSASTFKLYNNSNSALFSVDQGGSFVLLGPSAGNIRLAGYSSVGSAPTTAQNFLVNAAVPNVNTLTAGIRNQTTISNTASNNYSAIEDSIIINQGIQPSATGQWYGSYNVALSLAKNTVGAKTSIPAKIVGVLGKVTVGDTSLAIPYVAGLESHINLFLASTGSKAITNGYGLHVFWTDANSHLTTFTNWQGVKVDSMPANLIGTNNRGIWQDGTTGWNNLDAPTMFGDPISAQPTALIHIAAGTTAAAQLRFAAGVAPSSPNDGDTYYVDTNDRLMFRQNATDVEILGVSAVTSTTPTLQNRTLTIQYNGTTYYITAKTTND